MTVHQITRNLTFLLLFFLAGCYYDIEEDLYASIDCQKIDMSYQSDILPIIQNNCYVCHDAKSNFGNIILEGYDNLKNYADNGFLLGVIKHEAGFSPMPQNNNQLLECEIEKIESWISDGARNN